MARVRNTVVVFTFLLCGAILALTDQGFSLAVSQLTTLHGFSGTSDGAGPTVRLIADSTGVLYGTTANGGASGLGSVFQLSPPVVAGDPWTYTLLHSFGTGSDGYAPQSSLIIDALGNLYGTTYQGGAVNLGTVFKLAPPPVPGGTWTETVLYSFVGGSDGANPFGGLVLDSQGNLYGTTQRGGTYRCTAQKIPCGTVFQLAPSPNGTWSETILHQFSGRADGAFPDAGLTIDAAGVIYGTTQYGGSTNPRFGGSIFQLIPPPPGGSWTFNVLYDFFSTGMPSYYGDLVLDKAGAVYGTSWSGGAYGWGFVYKLIPPPLPGTAWKMKTLWSFSGGVDGSMPFGGVIRSGGALYGTTYSGGNLALCNAIGCGVVFKLTQKPGGGWQQGVLYTFQGGSDGATPQAGLLNSGGTLFGTTSAGFAAPPAGGTAFSLK